MPISDDEFRAWLTRDNSQRTIAVQMDYRYESVGAPAVGTVYLSDRGYIDEINGVAYIDAINSVPEYRRGLSGDRLGQFTSSLGSLELDNADGELDFMLGLACDGSEVRHYYGDASWPFSDFRLIFSAVAVKVDAPAADRISVQLKDSGFLLEQSIGGGSLVGGSGPNANRTRPINFGYVHNMELLVLDPAMLVYVHSDTGSNTTAAAVRDRGIAVTYTDNGDGTLTLNASPDGLVTGDVVAFPSDSSPTDPNARMVSDAFMEFVGRRAGFVAAGRYQGAHATFTLHDDDDYLLGISLPEPRNFIDLTTEIVDSGNCFWAITRDNKFTFGRLRPNNIAAFGLTPTDINDDDIDLKTLTIAHSPAQYYRYQGYMSKNWVTQTDLASSLTPDEQAVWTRKGIYLLQDDAVGTGYSDKPELYDLTLAVSPVLETLLSGAFDELDLPFLATWMETRRAAFLPWIEIASFTTGIDFYEKELGDVVRLTTPRFGYDAGVLFQVMAVNLRLSAAKVEFQLVRRRLLSEPPPEWTRLTVENETTPIPYARGRPFIDTGGGGSGGFGIGIDGSFRFNPRIGGCVETLVYRSQNSGESIDALQAFIPDPGTGPGSLAFCGSSHGVVIVALDPFADPLTTTVGSTPDPDAPYQWLRFDSYHNYVYAISSVAGKLACYDLSGELVWKVDLHTMGTGGMMQIHDVVPNPVSSHPFLLTVEDDPGTVGASYDLAVYELDAATGAVGSRLWNVTTTIQAPPDHDGISFSSAEANGAIVDESGNLWFITWAIAGADDRAVIHRMTPAGAESEQVVVTQTHTPGFTFARWHSLAYSGTPLELLAYGGGSLVTRVSNGFHLDGTLPYTPACLQYDAAHGWLWELAPDRIVALDAASYAIIHDSSTAALAHLAEGPFATKGRYAYFFDTFNGIAVYHWCGSDVIAPGPAGADNYADAPALVWADAVADRSCAVTDTSTFTIEAGESVHGVLAPAYSAWWKITPASNGTLTVKTDGSMRTDGGGGSLDTVIEVSHGTDVSTGYGPVDGQNDDGPHPPWSELTIAVTGGVTYHICVASYNAPSGYGGVVLVYSLDVSST